MLGYGRLRVNGQIILAHRIAYYLSRQRWPVEECVCHYCDNPSCCNPWHLFEGTRVDNNQDRHNKGRSKGSTGQRNSHAILQEADVRAIRISELDVKSLAFKYNVNSATIRDILTRRNWAWLK